MNNIHKNNTNDIYEQVIPIYKLTEDNLIYNIKNYYNPIEIIPYTYEKLPKCLIKFIDIGSIVKIGKKLKYFGNGRLVCFYQDYIIIKNKLDYIYVDYNIYDIYIYNPELSKKKSTNKTCSRILTI